MGRLPQHRSREESRDLAVVARREAVRHGDRVGRDELLAVVPVPKPFEQIVQLFAFHRHPTIRPSLIVIVRSARAARLSSCVMTTTVCPSRCAQLEEKPVDLLAVVRIEIARRFVGQQHRRRVDQRTGNGRALLLTARQRGGFVVAACREPHQIEQLRRPRPDFAPVAPADQPRQADVFESGELGQQVMELEDEADTAVAETRQLPVRQNKRIDAAERDAPAVGARERPR